jgi:hypothetical protein
MGGFHRIYGKSRAAIEKDCRRPAEAGWGQKSAGCLRFFVPTVPGEEIFLKKTAGAANLLLDSDV